jgi:hypothetical protein
MNYKTPPFVIVYFIVWAVLAVGWLILYRVRRDVEFRIRWHAKISLAAGIMVLAFMFFAFPSWQSLLFIGGFGGLIIFLNLTKTTICKSCGRIVQSVDLVQCARHCPHCGGETVRSKIFAA